MSDENSIVNLYYTDDLKTIPQSFARPLRESVLLRFQNPTVQSGMYLQKDKS